VATELNEVELALSLSGEYDNRNAILSNPALPGNRSTRLGGDADENVSALVARHGYETRYWKCPREKKQE